MTLFSGIFNVSYNIIPVFKFKEKQKKQAAGGK
jgi:hypothetical protein